MNGQTRFWRGTSRLKPTPPFIERRLRRLQGGRFGDIGVVVPTMKMPDEPIGRLKDGELLLDPGAIRK